MRKSLLVVLLAMLAIGATLSAQAVKLVYKDTPGTARTYKGSYSMTGKFTIPGHGEMPMSVTMNFTVREKVLQLADDGSAQIADEMQESTVTVKISDKSMNKAFPGMAITYERTASGKISNVQTTGEGAEMLKGIQSMGGINGMEQNMLSQFGAAVDFPNDELNAGDAWKMTSPPIEPLPGMKFDMDGTYKYVGVKVTDKKTLQQIDRFVSVKVPRYTMQSPKSAAVSMTIGGNMDAKGTSLFDDVAGALYSAFYTSTMKITVSMTNPETGDTMSAGGTMTVTSWMKQVKVEKE